MGYSFGGLFAFNAAWKRHEYIGRAACESSSFWWPTNADDAENEFEFLDTLDDTALNSNRLPQKIVIDVGGAEENEEDEDYLMVSTSQRAARKMMGMPYFE